jgi:Tfp pilus assembly protein PilP
MKNVLTLFIFLILALGGCGEKAQEHLSAKKLPPLPQPTTIRPQGGLSSSLPAVPVKKQDQSAPLYNPTGKPDPFQPAKVSLEAKGAGMDKILPLEQFEVSDFELIGIVSGSGTKKAMVQDLTGKGFLVQVGTRIGKRGGRVTRIAEKEIIIEEPYQDYLGRKDFRKIALRIPEPR